MPPIQEIITDYKLTRHKDMTNVYYNINMKERPQKLTEVTKKYFDVECYKKNSNRINNLCTITNDNGLFLYNQHNKYAIYLEPVALIDYSNTEQSK
jgi:hypothetical protein